MNHYDIDAFLMANKDYLPEDKLLYIKARLQAADPARLDNLVFISFQSPVLMLIVSLFVGELGIDRFLIGDIGQGIGKLLTGGGCGVWWFVDLFCIMKATKERNFQKLALYL